MLRKLFILSLFASIAFGQTRDTVKTTDTPNQGRQRWNGWLNAVTDTLGVHRTAINSKMTAADTASLSNRIDSKADTADLSWDNQGSFVSLLAPTTDTVKIGTLPANLNQGSRTGGTDFAHNEFRPRAWIEKALGVFPDAQSPYYTAVNLYMANEGFASTNLLVANPSGKYIAQWFVNATDVVENQVTADSLRPMLIPWGVYDTNNAAINLAGIVGDDFIGTDGPHYRGEHYFGGRKLVGTAIGLISRVGYPSGNSVTSISRSSEDSTNIYLQMRHGPNAWAKQEFLSDGQIWTYDDSAAISPYARKGWKLSFLSGGVSNKPYFQGGTFQFQAKTPDDVDYSYLTIGGDLVNANSTTFRAKNYQITTNSQEVITNTGKFVGDTSYAPLNIAPYTGVNTSGYYLGTLSLGNQKFVNYGVTFDDIALGNANARSLGLGAAPNQTQSMVTLKSNTAVTNFFQAFGADGTEKFKIDTVGSVTTTGKIGNIRVGAANSASTYFSEPSLSYDASFWGTLLVSKNSGAPYNQFTIMDDAADKALFTFTNNDTLVIAGGIRQLNTEGLRIMGGSPSVDFVWRCINIDGTGAWSPDTSGGGTVVDSGAFGGISLSPFANFHSDSLRFIASNTISYRDNAGDSAWIDVDTSYIETKYGTKLDNGKIFVGDAANRPQNVTMSQDATLDNTGALTIANGAVSLAKMANLGNSMFIGRETAGTGVPEALSATSVRTILSVPVFDLIDPGATDIFPKWDDTGNEVDWESAATYRTSLSLQNVTNESKATMFTSPTFTGTPTFTLGSDATGDIFYRNSSGNFARLGIGTNGYRLGVSSGLPAWAASDTTGDGTKFFAKQDKSAMTDSINAHALTDATSDSTLLYINDDSLISVPNVTWAEVQTLDATSSIQTQLDARLTTALIDTSGKALGTTLKWNGAKWVDSTDNTSSASFRVTLATPVLAALTWTNMPSALSFWMSTATVGKSITKADLTNFTEVRLLVNKQGTSGAASSKVIFRYLTTFTQTASSWLDIGTSEVSVATNNQNTFTTTSWIALAAGAKADVFISLLGSGGDGTLDPSFGMIVAEFR